MAAEGFDVGAIPEELACSVLCESQLVNSCQQQICKDCLESSLHEKKTACPHYQSTDVSRKSQESKVDAEKQDLTDSNVNEGEDLSVGHLQCPQGCELSLPPDETLESHQETCPLEPVSCPLSGLGCEAKICRRDMEQHVQVYALQHMIALVKSHTVLQTQQVALQVDQEMLQAEHAALKAECVTLGVDYEELKCSHTSLQAEHKMLKDSYTAKVKAVEPIVRSIPHDPHSCQLAQIYTIMADTSTVSLGGSVSLVLSESNAESGHHCFTISQEHAESMLLRLEWSVHCRHPTATKYSVFELFLLSSCERHPAGSFFDVILSFSSDPPLSSASIASVCCGRPTSVREVDEAKKLVGSLPLDQQLQENEQVTIFFNNKHPKEGCSCQCHKAAVSAFPNFKD